MDDTQLSCDTFAPFYERWMGGNNSGFTRKVLAVGIVGACSLGALYAVLWGYFFEHKA